MKKPRWWLFWHRIWMPLQWAWFWSGWVRCPLGWHQYWVLYITDGSTNVWCKFCRKEREPTAKELAGHPNIHFTPEQQAKQNAEVDAVLKWLDENGYGDKRARTDPGK